MLVYGDIERIDRPTDVLKGIERAMLACRQAPPGRPRHELLVQTFIETGELVQGLADREFERNGADSISAVQDTGAELLLAQAKAILGSWQDQFAGDLSLSADTSALLRSLDHVGTLRMKRAEGYSFYAVYPESYLEAALRSHLPPDTIVIGIRSIGLSLAALVAAALGARPAFSLRPIGHPFHRQLKVNPVLAKRIVARPDLTFAVVDEGPGLSGSSFASVAEWLETNGVDWSRIHFFPSHKGNPGAHADDAQQERWQALSKHVVQVEDLVINTKSNTCKLKSWVGELVGNQIEAWRDISGGNWRALRYDNAQDWPPSHRQMEKLKFVATADDRSWHVKFAGLSRNDAQKARRGSLLHEAGFTLPVIGICHGFLVEEWSDGRPIETVGMHRHEILARIGSYLAFRARYLPAPHGGASFETLCRMATTNVGEAAGVDAAGRLAWIMQQQHHLVRHLRPVDTDNRLHRWEWLATDDGRFLKTDALDHNGAHDLIGCQSIAWDIAGASVEFDLTAGERDRLVEIVMHDTDADLDEGILNVFEAAYLGFQIGLWSMASASEHSRERGRIENILSHYLGRLRPLIAL